MEDAASIRPLRVLVVDDQINIRKTLGTCLEIEGHQVVAVSNGPDALAESALRPFDLAFVDLRLGAASGLELIPALRTHSPWMRIVIITAHGTIDSAVETMKRGAWDFLTKPFTPAQVKLITDRVAHMRTLEQEVAGMGGALGQSESQSLMRSSSPPMQMAVQMARQVARSDTTILIRGESGTGKGVLARAIHTWSARASKPMATVSCPALPAQLLESELFGHVRGAFTGAVRDNPGRVAACDGGTLFLDEIADLPLELQPKLLRFVQDRQYERVGESLTRQADVRMICATNADLEDAVKAGKFRVDLLYRIQVVQIDLPPLRQRVEDIQDLAERFAADLSGGKSVGISPQAIAAMQTYRWPGNVRELRNVIERGLILSQGGQIGPEHLPPAISSAGGIASSAVASQAGELVSLDKLEETHIRRVLARTKSLDEAADVLGIDVATLWRRRKKYGI